MWDVNLGGKVSLALLAVNYDFGRKEKGEQCGLPRYSALLLQDLQIFIVLNEQRTQNITACRTVLRKREHPGLYLSSFVEHPL